MTEVTAISSQRKVAADTRIAGINYSDATQEGFVHSNGKKVYKLLAFVFAFACFFQHGEAGFFSIADGERLEDGGGVKAGDDFFHRPFAGGAFIQRLGRHGTA